MEINSLDEFKEIAESLNYTFAKTYAHSNPHEYCFSLEKNTLAKIRALNKYIDEHGEDEMFYRTPFKVLFAGSHKYWMVGDWRITKFLNRNWDFKDEDGTLNKSITNGKKTDEYKKK